MTNKQWKTCMSDFLDGIERELPPNTVAKNKVTLEKFRRRLGQKRITPSRKAFELELETFIESSSSLRAASKRHLGNILPPIVEAATAALKKARALLIDDAAKRTK